jgi:hypothetical protein
MELGLAMNGKVNGLICINLFKPASKSAREVSWVEICLPLWVDVDETLALIYELI